MINVFLLTTVRYPVLNSIYGIIILYVLSDKLQCFDMIKHLNCIGHG